MGGEQGVGPLVPNKVAQAGGVGGRLVMLHDHAGAGSIEAHILAPGLLGERALQRPGEGGVRPNGGHAKADPPGDGVDDGAVEGHGRGGRGKAKGEQRRASRRGYACTVEGDASAVEGAGVAG